MRKTKPLVLLAIAAIAFIVAGCTQTRERVLLPPEAPMEGIRSIAVVGIANLTVDPGIGLLFEQDVASRLGESDRYIVVDSALAKATLARLDMTIDQLADPASARRFGRELGVDAFVTGAATYYFEDVTISAPSCINCDRPDRPPYWSVRQTTTAVATFQARVIRTDTGAIVWSKQVEGRDANSRTLDINWNDRNNPPPFIPTSDRRDIPFTRSTAVSQAAGRFAQDLLPRYVWVAVD